MQQLRIHGASDVRLDEVAEPELGADDVIVRIAACGICGTDLGFIHGGVDVNAQGPMALGHEMSGTVDAVGADVTDVQVGDRVVVHPGDEDSGRIGNGAPEGGFATRLLVRHAGRGGRVHRIPDDLDLVTAALAEPVAVGMHAAERAVIAPDQKVVIFGCGPIGLSALATLVDQGHEEVIAVDLSARRLDLAREIGAQATLDPATGNLWDEIRERHGTSAHMFGPMAGTDAFIEATGAGQVIVDVIANARAGARLTVVAVHYQPVAVDFLHVLTKQLTINAAMEYPERFEAAIELLARKDLSSMITHRFPIQDHAQAVEVLSGSRDCGKVLITFP